MKIPKVKVRDDDALIQSLKHIAPDQYDCSDEEAN